MSGGDAPGLYGELADWFHLLTAPEDYAEEAAVVLGLLRDAVDGPLATLLELGAGGGNTASHLRHHLRLTLTDASEAMLRQSRAINPGCEHLACDMRTVRLGRTFDAVLIHDAVMHMTTLEDLRAAIDTAFAHLRPGGAAVFAPDAIVETWHPDTRHGGHDGADGRALRYLEWTFDPDPDDATFVAEFAVLAREPDGQTRVVHDRQLHGLFARAAWLGQLAEAGFTPDEAADQWGRVLFVARRPPGE